MKRQLISLMIILPLLSLFSPLEVYAQGGNPILGPPPPPPKTKPIRGGRSASGRKPVGLSNVEYTDRYRKIYYDYTSSKATLNETVASLEELVKLAGDDSVRSITYQFLGLLYLHGLKDAEKAEGAMERAIKANGSALIEISFDNKWRQMTKSRSGQYDFEDGGRGWIKIESGRLTLTDLKSQPLLNDKAPASLTGQQIKEVSKTLNSAYPLVKIITDNSKRPYLFAAGSKLQVEADLVIKLIQKHVLGKATAEIRR
jgi:hypothetical protein